MKQYFMLGLFCIGLTVVSIGCEFLDPETRANPDGSTYVTYQGEKYLVLAKDIADKAAKTELPFVSLIAGSISGLLAISTGVLGKIASNRNNAAKASILAIESFAKDFDKLKETALTISKMTGNPEIYASYEKIFEQIKPIKQLAEEKSIDMNIEKILDSMVQRTVKSYPQPAVT